MQPTSSVTSNSKYSPVSLDPNNVKNATVFSLINPVKSHGLSKRVSQALMNDSSSTNHLKSPRIEKHKQFVKISPDFTSGKTQASVTSDLVNPTSDRDVKLKIPVPLFDNATREVTIRLQLPGEAGPKTISFKVDSYENLKGAGFVFKTDKNGKIDKVQEVTVYITNGGKFDVKVGEKNFPTNNKKDGKLAGSADKVLDKFAELNPNLKLKGEVAAMKARRTFSLHLPAGSSSPAAAHLFDLPKLITEKRASHQDGILRQNGSHDRTLAAKHKDSSVYSNSTTVSDASISEDESGHSSRHSSAASDNDRVLSSPSMSRSGPPISNPRYRDESTDSLFLRLPPHIRSDSEASEPDVPPGSREEGGAYEASVEIDLESNRTSGSKAGQAATRLRAPSRGRVARFGQAFANTMRARQSSRSAVAATTDAETQRLSSVGAPNESGVGRSFLKSVVGSISSGMPSRLGGTLSRASEK